MRFYVLVCLGLISIIACHRKNYDEKPRLVGHKPSGYDTGAVHDDWNDSLASQAEYLNIAHWGEASLGASFGLDADNNTYLWGHDDAGSVYIHAGQEIIFDSQNWHAEGKEVKFNADGSLIMTGGDVALIGGNAAINGGTLMISPVPAATPAPTAGIITLFAVTAGQNQELWATGSSGPQRLYPHPHAVQNH